MSQNLNQPNNSPDRTLVKVDGKEVWRPFHMGIRQGVWVLIPEAQHNEKLIEMVTGEFEIVTVEDYDADAHLKTFKDIAALTLNASYRSMFFYEGLECGCDREVAEDNPYPVGSDESRDWEDGRIQAENEREYNSCE